MHSPPVLCWISPCQLLVLLFSCCCSLLSHIVILALTLVNLEEITWWKKKLILRPELKVPLFVFPGSPFGARGFLFSDIWDAFQAFKYFTAPAAICKSWSHPSSVPVLVPFVVLLSCPSPPSVRSSSPSILHAFHSRLSLCCPICLASFLRSEKKERSILASIPVPPCITFPVFSLALQIQKVIQPYHLFLPPSFIPCILPSSASLPFLLYIHVSSFHPSHPLPPHFLCFLWFWPSCPHDRHHEKTLMTVHSASSAMRTVTAQEQLTGFCTERLRQALSPH